MKIVEYKSVNYEVPDWAMYIAADHDGEVYAYEYEPEWDWENKSYNEPVGRAREVFPEIERPELKRI